MTEAVSMTQGNSSAERSGMIEDQEAFNRPSGMWAVLLAIGEYLDGPMREAIDHYANKMIAIDTHTIEVNKQGQEAFEEHTRILEGFQEDIDNLDPDHDDYAEHLQEINVAIMGQQALFDQDQALFSGAISILENLSLKISNEPSMYIQEQSKLVEIMDRVISSYQGSFQAASSMARR